MLSATYRRCPACQAPIFDPFPADWNLDLIKEGPAAGPVDTFVTAHLPWCKERLTQPAQGMAIRVPARTLNVGINWKRFA
jgi:hypothetical protein